MADSMGQDTTKLEQSLSRYQSIVVAGLAFIVVFAVTMMGVMLWQSYRLGEQAQALKQVATTTHDALCASLNARIAEKNASEEFLKEHPDGLRDRDGSVLIPSVFIERDIDNQKRTIDAYAAGGLTCP